MSARPPLTWAEARAAYAQHLADWHTGPSFAFRYQNALHLLQALLPDLGPGDVTREDLAAALQALELLDLDYGQRVLCVVAWRACFGVLARGGLAAKNPAAELPTPASRSGPVPVGALVAELRHHLTTLAPTPVTA